MFLEESRLRDSVKGGALTEVTFFILLSLYTPNHGYGIMKFILFSYTLQERSWITPLDDGKGRKKEYVITKTGKEMADIEIKRLKNLISIAEEIMGGQV